MAGAAVAVLLAAFLASPAPPSRAQAVRTCVDRWNQGNMVGWGPAVGSAAFRRLDVRERKEMGAAKPERARCTVALAADGRRRTWICVLDDDGAYVCPIRHEPFDVPLRNENASIDRRGVLKLDAPLPGTHATPPLPWQRRYPHVDGFILPWTRSGRLRHGLRLDQIGAPRHSRGICSHGSEMMFDRSALRCVSDVQLDPCFARTPRWNRRGAVVACGYQGWTRFQRFVILRRS
jgi:hypothetical protein